MAYLGGGKFKFTEPHINIIDMSSIEGTRVISQNYKFLSYDYM